MKEICRLILILILIYLAACRSKQSLNDKVKEKIQEIAIIQLKHKDIRVEKVDQLRGGRAIAEANFKLAFELSKANGGDWKIEAVRLGDRNWVELKTFLSALDEVRSRETRKLLQKLDSGMEKFKETTGKYPQAQNIVKLTDILFPTYMSELVRYDSWNRELIFNSRGPDSFELLSLGPDGLRSTADDLVWSP